MELIPHGWEGVLFIYGGFVLCGLVTVLFLTIKGEL